MSNHTVEIINSCEQRISVTVDPKEVQQATQKIVAKKANNLKYGGFRSKSSVTKKLITKNLTPQEEADIQRELCSKTFSSICEKENIQYVGTPLIENNEMKTDGSFQYVALLETYPPIDHVKWEEANIEKIDTIITEENLSTLNPLLLKKIGLEEIITSKELSTQWFEWIIEVFQHQQLRAQVMQALSLQNTVTEIPSRVVEARYQELKSDNTENQNEEQLREKARQYIAADILFKAYAKEHQITLTQELLLSKIQKAAQNPFIMDHVKDPNQLPYYLAPRLFEEEVIRHLSERANCTTKMLDLEQFIVLALNLTEDYASETEETTSENAPIEQEETTA